MSIADYINEYGWITTILGGLILIVLYVHYWWTKSYFEEKGRNLATKEDIEDITKITETIKNELDLLSKNKFSLITERRNATILLLKQLQKCYTLVAFNKLYITALNTNEEIAIKYLDNLEFRKTNLYLYTDDKEIYDQIEEFIETFMDMVQLFMANKTETKEYQTLNGNLWKRLDKITEQLKPIIRNDLI